MYYAIVCKNPFIYLHNEKEDVLRSDYEFVIEDWEDCGIPKGFVPEEYQALSPSAFSRILDAAAIDCVYTFSDGVLVRRKYKKVPYFYLNPADVYIEYPTYCSDSNTIKAALLTNEQLLPVVSELVREEFQDDLIDVSLDNPVSVAGEDAVLAYVCMPIVMKQIPIGVESEEEKQELQADIDETEV